MKINLRNDTFEQVLPEFDLSSFGDLSITNSVICQGTPNSSRINVKSKFSVSADAFDNFFLGMVEGINSFSVSEKFKNWFYMSLESFLENCVQFVSSELESLDECPRACKSNTKSKIMFIENYIKTKISGCQTTYRRLKQLKSISTYVEPIEKSVGLKWKSTVDSKTKLPDHKLEQTTLQFVSILGTLQALFSQPDFSKTYFDNCDNPDFCCSKAANQNEIFSDSRSIQILLSADDFDPCDANKSKNVRHKLNALYFVINNLSKKYLSKNNNMYLVSLCETTNLKQEDTHIDDVSALIIEEIRQLETTGINVGGQTIKGSLVHVSADNLGANGIFGFVESFNSSFCRYCETTKKSSESTTKENPNILRTKQSYSECVIAAKKFVESGKKIDFKTTKGVKRYSIFNNLQYYNIIDNSTFDIMHDLNEGVIPFFLTTFFDYCVTDKILKANEIQCRIRDYNYGNLCKKSIPSFIGFGRKNLGQNASQSHCLMIHLPFIFAEFKDRFEEVWICAESLLKLMQICYSKEISENDLERLTLLVKIHLKSLIDLFKVPLLPKHHYLIHYPSAIRKMGPLINYWMMRCVPKVSINFSHKQQSKHLIS